METPQALREAGLTLEYQDNGTRLIVRDDNSEGSAIRNRGGEALARLLKEDRKIKSLDIRDSKISDNGLGCLCLALRQTDQLTDLALSPVGHTGLEFLLGVMRRCSRLASLQCEVVDVPTLFIGRQNVAAADYSTANYVPEKKEGDEEEEGEAEEEDIGGDEDEDEDERKKRKLDNLRALFAENDYDSGDESTGAVAGQLAADGGISPALDALLSAFLVTVRKKENLIAVSCAGNGVPSDLQLDLQRAAEEHLYIQDKKASMRAENGSRTAHDALKDQMEELRVGLEGFTEPQASVADILAGAEPESGPTSRLGMRSFVGRRLFAALGEALFECQRFKSKENEAVSAAQGEMAFIAMHLRKHAAKAPASKSR